MSSPAEGLSSCTPWVKLNAAYASSVVVTAKCELHVAILILIYHCYTLSYNKVYASSKGTSEVTSIPSLRKTHF